MGCGNAAMLTPSGRLLTKSSHAEDRPAIFAAQFALSHGCWLVSYPLAGILITIGGATTAMIGLSGVAIFGLISAVIVWPPAEPGPVEHAHPEFPPDHPHVKDSGASHKHPITIDELHPRFLG